MDEIDHTAAPLSSSPPAEHESLFRKFGKQIQKRQLEVPEYAASFVNYKALKKVRYFSWICPHLGASRGFQRKLTVWQLIKKLSATPPLLSQNDVQQRALNAADSQAALQANKATFFFQLVR